MIRIFDTVCDCCGHEKDVTPEEIEYEESLTRLIKAARSVDRTRREVESDLHEWWNWRKVEEAAVFDKDVIRLWWMTPDKWSLLK